MTTTAWLNTLADNDGDNLLNWDNGVPTSVLDVTITGADDCTFAGAMSFKTLDCTGYTGTLTCDNPKLYGNCTLAAGMTLGGYFDFEFWANSTLTTNGKVPNSVYLTGAITLTIAQDTTISGGGVTNDGSGTFAFGANDLTIGDGPFSPAHVTYSAGAHLNITNTANINVSEELPPVVVTTADITITNMVAKSYTQTGGTLLGDGGGASVTDNMAVTNVTNINATFDFSWSVGGTLVADTCVFDGSAATSDMFAWNVTGTATGTDCDVNDCNFGAGSDFNVTGGTEGTGNTGVNYIAGNTAPTADAGDDQELTALPYDAELDGSGSSDPEMDSLTYLWSKVSGPGTVTFDDATAVDAVATFSKNGSYVLRLTVDDGDLNDADDVTILVNGPNETPEVDAGIDQAITLPTETITMDGSADDDGHPDDPGSISYLWELLSGPSPVLIDDASDPVTDVTGLASPGSYVFQLTADDGELNDTDTMTVVVTAATPATASAEDWQMVSMGTSTTDEGFGAVSDGFND